MQAKAALKSAAKTAQNKLNFMTGNVQAGIEQAVANLQASKDLAAFHAEMENQREAAKANADDAIDTWYDNAENYGTQYPDLRPQIMTSTNSFGAFVGNIVSDVVSFFSSIADWIKQAVQAVADWVAEAAQKVADWVANAAKAVANAISDAFSWL